MVRRTAGQRALSTSAVLGRIALAVVSVMVLGLSGYAWANLRSLSNGLATTDVITHGGALDGSVDILLVGMDSRSDAHGHPLAPEVLNALHAGADSGEANTDTMILLHIPVNGKQAMAMSLPRDSFVDVPGYGKHKLNSAYTRAKNDELAVLDKKGTTDPVQRENDSNQAGRKVLIQTVHELTGVDVDHYAEVNLASFYAITNAVGGVDVCLKKATKDKMSGADFRAGQQTVQGAAALSFVRQRHELPRGDLDRVVRQQVFLAGMAHKVLSAGTLADPGKLSGLMAAVTNSVVLDQGWDVLNFATQMQGLSGGAIKFKTMPVVGDLHNTGDGDALQVSPDQIKKFVHDFAGIPTPAAPSGAPGESSSASPPGAGAVIDVRNASGVSGLANRVQDSLVAQGFAKGDTGNSSTRTTSVVRYAKDSADAGQAVAKALGGLDTEIDSSVPSGHVQVVLGKAYHGPGASSSGFGGGGLVALDGKSTGSGDQQNPAGPPPDDGPTITADGVTCVN